jgi:ligand-binding sensor domain-containing protein
MKPNYFVIFILLLWGQVCLGDDFKYLRTNEGLYNGEINSIAQDQSGKMWFATWAGLTSYNGIDFQFFKPKLGNPLSLQDKKINKIFIDSSDNLWVSSLSSGISVFHKSDQTFHPVALQGTLPGSYYVFGLFESKGYVLIHTNRGIFLADAKNQEKKEISAKRIDLFSGGSKINDYPHYIYPFMDKILVVSNADSYSPTRMLISELIVSTKDTLIQIKERYVYTGAINAATYVKGEDRLYLGTTNGISTFTLSSHKIAEGVYFKNQNIFNLLYVSTKKIYSYSENPALMAVDLETRKESRYLPDPLVAGSLLDNNITCLFEDFSGSLWVGHQGLGLSILNLSKKPFDTFRRDPYDSESLRGNMVMCFNGTSREIFIGLRQGGINVTSKQMKEEGIADFNTLRYHQQPNAVSNFDHIWDFARESDSIYWVASDGGLAKLEKIGRGTRIIIR